MPWSDASVHVSAHALHYGSGVFEGMRCYETADGPAVFRMDEHLERLFASAAVYSMSIPYTREEIEDAICEVIERNGFVLAWYHPNDEPPGWEIPVIEEIGDPAWSDYYSSSYVIHTVPQEMSENGVDPAHFQYVHGTENVAEMESYDTDGPCSVMLSKQSYVTPRGVTNGRIDVYNYGPGFSKVWFSGIVDAINIATTTPIDDDTTQVLFNFIVRKFDDEKLTSTVADAFVKEINKQVQEDKPIWEHKRFLPTPALADTDGPIMKFRKWYSQFYAEPYGERVEQSL